MISSSKFLVAISLILSVLCVVLQSDDLHKSLKLNKKITLSLICTWLKKYSRFTVLHIQTKKKQLQSFQMSSFNQRPNFFTKLLCHFAEKCLVTLKRNLCRTLWRFPLLKIVISYRSLCYKSGRLSFQV